MLSVIHLITCAFKKILMTVLGLIKLILTVDMIEYGYFDLYTIYNITFFVMYCII